MKRSCASGVGISEVKYKIKNHNIYFNILYIKYQYINVPSQQKL